MTVTDVGSTTRSRGASGLWNRQLDTYPDTGPRFTYLAITVLATVMLYYELYVGGSVSVQILQDLHISFTTFVYISAVGNLIGAFASLFAGLTDRLGRTNLVVGGLIITGFSVLVLFPLCTNQWEFAICAWFVGTVEGICLVATPALIRDFSPQTGRATAMGFWTSGPVLGSLIVAEVGTLTIKGTPAPSFWTHEYRICGVAGLIVAAIAFFGLRELSPALRDQLMVSMKDRALVEARAKGLDIESALKNPFRQLIKPDVIISAVGVSVFLLVYYTAVGFGVIYLSTVFGQSTHNANALGNWNWGFNVIAVVIVGVVSDKLRVRKPLMVLGGVASAILMVAYLTRAGHPTSYYTLAALLAALSFSQGVAYTPWMASFTETVEGHNPALTATGLAIWGWIIRVVVFVSTIALPAVISSVTPLVNYGGTAVAYESIPGVPQALAIAQAKPQEIAFAQANASQLAALQKNAPLLAQAQNLAPELAVIQQDPATFTTLSTNPGDQAALAKAVADFGGGAAGAQKLGIVAANKDTITQIVANGAQLQQLGAFYTANSAMIASLQADAPKLAPLQVTPPGAKETVGAFFGAHGAALVKAEKDAPHQWKTWYWICFAGMIAFLGCVPLMKGRWSPAAAKRDEEAHEAMVQAELAKIGA